MRKNSIIIDSRIGYGLHSMGSPGTQTHSEQLSKVARRECRPLVHRCEVDRWLTKLRNKISRTDFRAITGKWSPNGPWATDFERDTACDLRNVGDYSNAHTPQFSAKKKVCRRVWMRIDSLYLSSATERTALQQFREELYSPACLGSRTLEPAADQQQAALYNRGTFAF